MRAATKCDKSYGDAAIAIVADEGRVKSGELNLGLLTRCSKVQLLWVLRANETKWVRGQGSGSSVGYSTDRCLRMVIKE